MARYPLATFVGANPNDYSTEKISPIRVVIHIEQGSETGTMAWFNNPGSKVSAHVGNPRVGQMQEFVDLAEMAYHCAAFNPTSLGAEHEGISGDKLNKNQLKNLRRFLQYAHDNLKIPLRFVTDPNTPGVIGHGHLPEGALSHPNCPGGPVLVQVNQLLASMRRRAIVKRIFHPSKHPDQTAAFAESVQDATAAIKATLAAGGTQAQASEAGQVAGAADPPKAG